MMIKKVDMKHILTKEYILSGIYKHTILKYITKKNDPYHVKKNVENWMYRTGQLVGLGSWRWLCTYKNRKLIAKYIFSDLSGIDFGGNNGPVYGNTEIVDKYPEHVYRQLRDIGDEELDYIYTSHTLEHVLKQDLQHDIGELNRILRPNGTLICMVPSYTNEHWRAGSETNSHSWTFAIDNNEWTRIDKMIEKGGFYIIRCEYTWDDSIFILARKS